MRFKNTENNFGIISIFFHWVMAIIIMALLPLGIYMKHYAVNLQKPQLYGWHKEFGILVLIIVFFRLIWKLTNIRPRLSLSKFESIAMRIVQLIFYGFMIAMPVSGLLISSAANKSASFFGLFTMPNLIPPNEVALHVFLFTHKWFGYVFIATILVHIIAALKHHYINKDEVLRRMISCKSIDG